MRPEPTWLDRGIIEALHQELIREYGGSAGLRDGGLIESALARPLHRWTYGHTDLAELAAACAYGLAKNHGFIDGNKRIAAAAMGVFLDLNGFALDAPEPELVHAMLAIAGGEWAEADLTAWLRDRIVQRPDTRDRERGSIA